MPEPADELPGLALGVDDPPLPTPEAVESGR